jgi:hypothetical protein
MPDYTSQISSYVDELVKDGAIPEGMRDEYVKMMTAKPETAERFAGSLMRGSDYTRKTQALAEQRRQQEAEIATERARVFAEQQALKQWETETKSEIERLRQFADQSPHLQAQIARYEQKLSDYNLLEDGDKVAIPTPQPKGESAMPTQTQVTQPNNNNLTREDAASALRDVMIMQGDLMDIAGEHQRLFGQPLSGNLMQEALNAGESSIRSYWEKKFNVGGKRAEVEASTRAAEIEKIRAETRAQVMAELTTDPSRVMGGQPYQQAQSSPIFDKFSSRAVSAATDGTVKPLSELSPELRPIPMATEARLDRAMTSYLKDFNLDGSPRLHGGPAQ